VANGSERRISPVTSGGCEPRFNRDGRRLVYVSRRLLGGESRLVEHDLASGEERALVSWPALNYDPVYSPDGTKISFERSMGGPNPYGIFTMNPDGSNVTPIISDSFDNSDQSWQSVAVVSPATTTTTTASVPVAPAFTG
jgi:Tol biopolymer transport system component